MNYEGSKYRTKSFNTRDSIRRAQSADTGGLLEDLINESSSEETGNKSPNPYTDNSPQWNLVAEGSNYTWNSGMERIEIIRRGIPYASVQKISQKLGTTIKEILSLLGIPQTTYNK